METKERKFKENGVPWDGMVLNEMKKGSLMLASALRPLSPCCCSQAGRLFPLMCISLSPLRPLASTRRHGSRRFTVPVPLPLPRRQEDHFLIPLFRWGLRAEGPSA